MDKNEIGKDKFGRSIVQKCCICKADAAYGVDDSWYCRDDYVARPELYAYKGESNEPNQPAS